MAFLEGSVCVDSPREARSGRREADQTAAAAAATILVATLGAVILTWLYRRLTATNAD